MKNIIIIIVLAAAGFFAYQQFFAADSFEDQVADELHKQMSMFDKSKIRTCAKVQSAGLSEHEKALLLESIRSEGKQTMSLDEAMQQMEKSMQFFNDMMNCMNG